MQYLLIIITVAIVGFYLPYLFAILSGNPQRFELKIVYSLAFWIKQIGPSAKKQMENIFITAAILEITYMALVFFLIDNSILLGVTAALSFFEVIHHTKTYINLRRFFLGNVMIKNILLWRYERGSCLLFVFHGILVLVELLG